MKKIICLILTCVILLSSSVILTSAEIQVSDELLNAINANGYTTVIKEDVSIYDMCELTSDKCLYRYYLKDTMVSCDVVVERIGQYRLYVPSRPVPMILADETLYEMTDAYKSGVLTDSDLEIVSKYQTRSFKFEYIGILYGDVDCDTYVDISDVSLIQRYKAGYSNVIDLTVADFDQDGEISVMDATAIQQKLAKK